MVILDSWGSVDTSVGYAQDVGRKWGLRSGVTAGGVFLKGLGGERDQSGFSLWHLGLMTLSWEEDRTVFLAGTNKMSQDLCPTEDPIISNHY